MKINCNISAQLANVSLKRADKKMTSSLERLSSGYKLNKAADDSAGMAISNKMRTQIRALDQASRNAGDGTSIIQTAEGALSEMESLLQRMRELSVQAANDTYTVDDRHAIQKEIDQMLDELDRIADTTDFNGTKLLDGSSNRVVTFDEIGMDSLGVSSSVLSGPYQLEVTALAEPAEVTGFQIAIPAQGNNMVKINDTTISISSTDKIEDVMDRVLSVCDMMGIEVTTTATAATSRTLTLKTQAAGEDQKITYRNATDTADKSQSGKDAKVELATSATATPAGTESQFKGTESISYNGNNITISDNSGFEMRLTLEDGIAVGDVRNLVVYDTGAMTLQIGANEHQNIDIDFPEVSCRTLALREEDGDNMVNVCSHYGASRAITAFDNAIQFISDYRSNLGAMENRLNSTISSLDISSENITDAMSRIMDTDMAEAMTNYTQESVLSQAATALLAP